jgi:ArsR family transcriptional regulator, arsenate/arsenite/antimonite-responsive transcriptional repressor
MFYSVDMMTAADVVALGQRLHKLTGVPDAECVPRYRTMAATLGRDPAFKEALGRFVAVADRRRLLALGMLKRNGELCACEIQAALGVSHPAVSHQMRILIRAGLVERERRGKWTHYRLTPGGADVLP